MSVLVNSRVEEHVRDAWKAEADRRKISLSELIRIAMEKELAPGPSPSGNIPPAEVRYGAVSTVSQATRVAAQLTPKQQKADPVSAVGRGFSTAPADLGPAVVTTFFKSGPVAKKGGR